jgi:formate-dependent nitrite reductase membrane component NrfD
MSTAENGSDRDREPLAAIARHIDPEIGGLGGEGALQRVRVKPPGEVRWHAPLPTESRELAESSTYYEVPVLPEPVWKWYVPAYFYVGGLAGACAVVGASAHVMGRRSMARLSRQCRMVAAAGAATSAALLIADLGRPARFFNMLRVFRPTSPMNMGTWILSGFGACAGLAVLPELVPVPSPIRRLADGASIGAGLFGLPLTGYTGVLLANTAVPLWQGAGRSLPILFSSSGAAAAASFIDLLPTSAAEEIAAHRLGVIAKAAELAMTVALEREVSRVQRVARPLRTGLSGTLWRCAQLLSAASLLISLSSRGRPRLRRLAGAFGNLASLALRFAVTEGGKRSARDPRATFEQQRAGLGAAELVRAGAGQEPSRVRLFADEQIGAAPRQHEASKTNSPGRAKEQQS